MDAFKYIETEQFITPQDYKDAFARQFESKAEVEVLDGWDAYVLSLLPVEEIEFDYIGGLNHV